MSSWVYSILAEVHVQVGKKEVTNVVYIRKTTGWIHIYTLR